MGGGWGGGGGVVRVTGWTPAVSIQVESKDGVLPFKLFLQCY